MSKTNKKIRRQRIRFIFGTCCVVALLVASGMIFGKIQKTNARMNMNMSLQQMYYSSVASAETVEETPAPEAAETAAEETEAVETAEATAEKQTEAAPAPADTSKVSEASLWFESMKEINEHMVGWLNVGPDINLPIVYHDNEFYLDHNFYGNKDEAGTVFINEANTIWPADQNLLFHGHNMKDGSAFGHMDKYRELDYLKANPIVYWHSIEDEEPVAYVPISIFEASMKQGAKGYFDIGHINFADGNAFMSFCQGAMDRSLFDIPVDVQEDDQLITLITCSYGYDNARFMMICRQLRADETVDGMIELMQDTTKN